MRGAYDRAARGHELDVAAATGLHPRSYRWWAAFWANFITRQLPEDREELVARFTSALVMHRSGCWTRTEFVGRCYGTFVFDQLHQVAAHKAAWLLFRGPIPVERFFVLHKCGVKGCCSPNHLYLGTQKENGQDRSRHLRLGAPVGARGAVEFLSSPPPEWLLEDRR